MTFDPASSTDPLAFRVPAPQAPAGRRRRRVRQAAVAVAVAVLVGGGVAATSWGSSPPSYRTARVGNHDVQQVLSGVGVVEPVSQATVGFPVAGTVATVPVAVGATVTRGQTLATLDPTVLQHAVDTAQATLAQADLTLERARNGESTGTGGARAGSATVGAAYDSSQQAAATVPTAAYDPSRPASFVTVAATAGSPDQELAAAQQKVLDAQKVVDAKLAAAQTALDSATQVCAAITTAPATKAATKAPAAKTAAQAAPTTTTAPGVTTTAPGATTTTSTTEAPGGASSTPDVTACQTALAAVQAAQQAVSAAQSSLSTAASAYDALLDQRAAGGNTGSGGGGGGGSTGRANTGSGSGGSGSGGSGSGGSGGSSRAPSGSSTSSGPSSADLVADQEAVDSAAADLAETQQSLTQATVVSPIDGTVVAVALAPGDSVTAGSTTQVVTVAGAGGFEVTTMVSVADVPRVKVGQQATVTPDGGASAIDGQVVAVSVAAKTGTTGTASYAVTIGLDDGAQLGNGTTASVAIVTGEAGSSLAVPTSAVHTTGTTHTVTVLDGGSTRDVTVQVGAMGTTWTAITGGLTDGQQVVLASLSEPLPGSATSSSSGSTANNRTGAGGARTGFFPGGGAGAGGPGFNN